MSRQYLSLRAVTTAVLIAIAQASFGEFAGNVAAVSDFRYRGFSESAGDPALQGNLSYDQYSGLFGGVFLSTVDYDALATPDYRAFYYVGYADRIRPNWSWEAGAARYDYIGSDRFDWDYEEYFLGLTWRKLNARINHSPDLPGGDISLTYLELNLSRSISDRVDVFAHFGHSDLGSNLRVESANDLRFGISYAFGRFTFEVATTATDLHDNECPHRDTIAIRQLFYRSISVSSPRAGKHTAQFCLNCTESNDQNCLEFLKLTLVGSGLQQPTFAHLLQHTIQAKPSFI